jgi:hypothetical protein
MSQASRHRSSDPPPRPSAQPRDRRRCAGSRPYCKWLNMWWSLVHCQNRSKSTIQAIKWGIWDAFGMIRDDLRRFKSVNEDHWLWTKASQPKTKHHTSSSIDSVDHSCGRPKTAGHVPQGRPGTAIRFLAVKNGERNAGQWMVRQHLFVTLSRYTIYINIQILHPIGNPSIYASLC